jgi:hypothetical protein
MPESMKSDQLKDECLRHFTDLVQSTGTKKFASCLDVTTRQVNRILSGAQPNPIERLIRCVQSASPEVGDRVIDYICQEMGGHFVREESINSAAVNAVRECAEAIAAISDGQVDQIDVREIREAISALSGLIMSLNKQHNDRRGPGTDGSSPRPPRGT